MTILHALEGLSLVLAACVATAAAATAAMVAMARLERAAVTVAVVPARAAGRPRR